MHSYIFLAALLLGACSPAAAQNQDSKAANNFSGNNIWDISIGYFLLRPGGAFAEQNVQKSMNFIAGRQLLNNRLMLGLEGSAGWQSPVMEDKTWLTENGVVNSSVHQESSLGQLALRSHYYIYNHSLVQLFALAGGGWLWSRGDINVYGMDEEECRLLENMRPARSSRPYGTLGAGLSLVSRWKKTERANHFTRIKFNLTAQYLVAGNISMYNVRTPEGPLPAGAQPIQLRFVDPRTNTEHTHKAGYVQQGPLRGWQFGLGLSFNFSTPKKAALRGGRKLM